MADIKELRDEELREISGGSFDPNTGEGLVVGEFLQHKVNTAMFYKITNVNSLYYNVDTYIKGGCSPTPLYVFMQISFSAVARGEVIPCSAPTNAHLIVSTDY